MLCFVNAKVIKKMISLITIFSIIVTCTNISKAESKLPFSDVSKTSWYYETLVDLYDRNIITGFQDNTFRPTNTLTRNQFIKMLVVNFANGVDILNYKSVNSNTWFTPYFNYAKLANIIDSDKEEEYYKENITREEVAYYVYKVLCIGKVEEYIEEDMQHALNNDDIQISDISDAKSECVNAIYVLFDKKILNGYKDGTFRPKGILTRAESTSVCKLLNEEYIYDRINGKTLPEAIPGYFD